MESSNNPYQTPAGQLTPEAAQWGEIGFFSPSIRLGRLRYLSHGFVLLLACYLLLILSVALALFVSGLFWLSFAAGYIAMLIISFILMIQRLHDVNQSGWLSLLIFVPLVNFFFIFYLIFAPGTKGSNNYGLPPPPNKTWNWVFGFAAPILVIVALIGVVAAVSIPAYQDFQERVRESNYGHDYEGLDEDDSQVYDEYEVMEYPQTLELDEDSSEEEH